MAAIRRLIRASWEENYGLSIAIIFHAAFLALCVLAAPFDHRQILGLNPWIKPIKFQISTIVYAATIACFLALLGERSRFARQRSTIGWGIAVAMIVENSLISMQSLRGVRSHMNYTSLFDGVVFGTMGVFIVWNTAMIVWLLWLYRAPQRGLARPVAWGIRLGLLILLAGSVEGAFISVHGSHTVGAADGAAGLPLVNWSTGHGDLRIAHFFALHALQLLPLVGFAIARFGARFRLREALQLTALAGFAAFYLGGLWLLFQEAMAGRPLLG